MATLRLASSSSTMALRKDTRSTRKVSFRYSLLTSASVAACALARRNTLRVGSPAMMSRKYPDSRASDCHCRSTSRRVYQPTRIMNTGINGTVSTRISVVRGSCVSAAPATTTGMMQARNNCGR